MKKEYWEVHSLLKIGVITWFGPGYYQVRAVHHWIARGSNSARVSHGPYKPHPVGPVDFGVEPVAPLTQMVKEVVQPLTVAPIKCHVMGPERPHLQP